MQDTNRNSSMIPHRRVPLAAITNKPASTERGLTEGISRCLGSMPGIGTARCVLAVSQEQPEARLRNRCWWRHGGRCFSFVHGAREGLLHFSPPSLFARSILQAAGDNGIRVSP